MTGPVLSIQGLSVALPEGADRRLAVEDVSLDLNRGETLCIVGESGSGKSITAFSVAGLLSRQLTPAAGKILFDGTDLLKTPESAMRKIRGARIAMIFQEPMTALNPVLRCGKQITRCSRRMAFIVIRLRPTHRGHVWSYDFVANRTHDGKAFRMLTVIDEYSRECLAIHVQRQIKSDDVLAVLAELFIRYAPPEHIRSDNGAEFTAIAMRGWLGRIGVKTLYIEPGSPWENGYCESFNGKLRDEFLNGEIFYMLKEAQNPY